MQENENLKDINESTEINKEHEELPSTPEELVSEPQVQAKVMEVHTHSHTPRKKWSHYFWEFLMLFLAVFCGFLAEYKLEHVIENQREATLMNSLMEDLKADELTLTKYQNWRTETNNDFDSLLVLLSNPEIGTNTYSIYEKSNANVLRFGLPDIYEGTIQQLKNAGGLRLVRKKEVLNAINNHYLKITRLKSVYDVEVLLRVRLTETMSEVLDAKLLINNDNQPETFSLITSDNLKINNFMNSIIAAKKINQRLIDQLEATKVSTIELNKLVEKEYL